MRRTTAATIVAAAGLVAAGLLAAAGASGDDVDRRALARVQRPPLGLPPVPETVVDDLTVEKIRLGRALFLDRRLSVNSTLSCAMCHVPEQAFTVNETRTAVGHEGATLRRNAPTLLNVVYAAPFFHDGREPDLDLQPMDVLINPDEMAMPSLGAVVERVRSLAPYPSMFRSAFGGDVTVERVGRAIAAYASTLLSAASPFDRWYFAGERDAMSAAAVRGFELFSGGAGCVGCHHVGRDSALFRDGRFHDTGLGRRSALTRTARRDPVRVELAPGVFATMDADAVRAVGEPPAPDLGRAEVTGDPADRWRYKTPSLRNVALTAPYMHDGSLSTLEDVVEFYRRGGVPHDGIDPLIRPLDLGEGDVRDLVAFLESLTGDGLDELVADARSQEVGNPGASAPR